MQLPFKTRTVPSIFTCPACNRPVNAVQYCGSGLVLRLQCVSCDWTWT